MIVPRGNVALSQNEVLRKARHSRTAKVHFWPPAPCALLLRCTYMMEHLGVQLGVNDLQNMGYNPYSYV